MWFILGLGVRQSGAQSGVQEATLCGKPFLKTCASAFFRTAPGAEKETVMEQFRRGSIDVLIATSIIEVGSTFRTRQ